MPQLFQIFSNCGSQNRPQTGSFRIPGNFRNTNTTDLLNYKLEGWHPTYVLTCPSGDSDACSSLRTTSWSTFIPPQDSLRLHHLSWQYSTGHRFHDLLLPICPKKPQQGPFQSSPYSNSSRSFKLWSPGQIPYWQLLGSDSGTARSCCSKLLGKRMPRSSLYPASAIGCPHAHPAWPLLYLSQTAPSPIPLSCGPSVTSLNKPMPCLRPWHFSR